MGFAESNRPTDTASTLIDSSCVLCALRGARRKRWTVAEIVEQVQ